MSAENFVIFLHHLFRRSIPLEDSYDSLVALCAGMGIDNVYMPVPMTSSADTLAHLNSLVEVGFRDRNIASRVQRNHDFC